MQRPGTGPQLPSIRSLHPYLPPPTAVPLPYQPPSAPTHPVASSSAAPASSYTGSDPERDAEPEADPEEPPKKKRRRQALSCTECKRRKIRCDRRQPCEPCTKRGNADKCQWHVIEPAEGGGGEEGRRGGL
ncbi:hypothetical protein C8R44DRAFT_383203 [Mycena epipterygia]|nr:hypothetical protein C8R44DRAFT_383203 [Mycena epipterygia]